MYRAIEAEHSRYCPCSLDEVIAPWMGCDLSVAFLESMLPVSTLSMLTQLHPVDRCHQSPDIFNDTCHVFCNTKLSHECGACSSSTMFKTVCVFFQVVSTDSVSTCPPAVSPGWPSCDQSRIIIHLNSPSPHWYEDSDASCLYVALSPTGVVQLMRGHMTDGSVHESIVTEGDYERLMMMAVKRPIPWKEATHLMEYLSQCLLDAENSVASMTFNKVRLSVYGCHGDAEDPVDIRPCFLPAFQTHQSSTSHHGNKMMRNGRGKKR